MERTKLEAFNHWWIKDIVDTELALPFKRDSYREIEQHLDKRFITALIGLRRVGKTTTIYQLIQKLLKDTKSTNILFFSFDEMSASLGEVIETYQAIHANDFREEKVYVFLDEIQKCTNWENELKKYYDLYPKLKFIVSGSASLFIRKKTKETLAGRIFEFILPPFTFREYLRFKGIEKEKMNYETTLQPLFMEFVKRGGFPETFTFESDKEFKEYLRGLIIDAIIYKDIPKTFKIEDPSFLGVLLELIATNPGMYVDYQSLSKQFDKDRRVVKDYLTYLQDSFLIRLLSNYRKGSFTTLRKKKRAYPADTSLIYFYKPTIEEGFFGRMVETLVVNTLPARFFWKNGNEIDIVHRDIPLEVKYQEKINSEDFKPLQDFMKKFKKGESIMITKREEKNIALDEGIVRLIPVWKWLVKMT